MHWLVKGTNLSIWESAGQSLPRALAWWRKVRAPQDRMPGNTWGARAYGKCHRKYTAAPPAGIAVRVKWCGKSAPRRWQHRWQGKPHPEQDQIGEPAAMAAMCGPHSSRVGR